MDGQCPMTDFYFIVFGAENICQDMICLNNMPWLITDHCV